ncbi:MAG: M12 family metallo-peptidase [Bacteroidota bacterium]|nr:M12 family metallo-peptidase [Bacteroidota bacterium]
MKIASSLVLIIVYCLVAFSASAQEYPLGLENKLTTYFNSNPEPIPHHLFTEKNIPLSLISNLSSALSSYQVVELDLGQLEQLFSSKPPSLSIELEDPEHKIFSLRLIKNELFSQTAQLLTSSGTYQNLITGLHYHGIVEGVPGSIAAISIFEHEIMMMVSFPGSGNLIVGKMDEIRTNTESHNGHLVYYEKDLLATNPFECFTNSNAMPPNNGESLFGLSTIFPNPCGRALIHLECDYQMYIDKGSNVNNVVNYVSGLFNMVSTLYENESIKIGISDIFVWTTQDPFARSDSGAGLGSFVNYKKSNFNGNLAALLTTVTNNNGGRAYVDVLCTKGFSYNNIHNSYNQVPTYSWSVQVLAHELGHNFGSPHTQNCSWGPNKNAALDNCYTTEGGCALGPPATGGGTIMSYCHLTQFGINFSKGFGKEPGDLIRSKFSSASCLTKFIEASTSVNINGPYLEGDNVKIIAKPTEMDYTYDWFHYDYKIPNAKDTIYKVNYSGIYKVAVSDNCTEYGDPDTIQFKDFLVNLGCPVTPGKKDSFMMSVILDADDITDRDSFVFPDTIFNKIPTTAKDILVEIKTTITPNGNSWTQSVFMTYSGPITTNIFNAAYRPNAKEPLFFTKEKTYSRILGRFDPKGKWVFTANDIRPDAGIIDAKVTQQLILSWRFPDTATQCTLPLCEGKSKILDAGISGATYTWSNGVRIKTLSVNKPGTYSVTVTKNSKSSRHTIYLVTKPLRFTQSITICDGDSLNIGKHTYAAAGTFIDTLVASDLCDSILTTELTVLNRPITYSKDTICYGEEYLGIKYFSSTSVQIVYQAFNGCDSIHEIDLFVTPEIHTLVDINLACENIGADVDLVTQGGSGNLLYTFSHDSLATSLKGLKSGQYAVTVTDERGCNSRLDFEIKNYDTLNIQSQIKFVRCYSESNGEINLDVLSGTAPYLFQWSSGNNTSSITNLTAGKYQIMIVDANGCNYQQEFEVIEPEELMGIVETKPSSGSNGSINVTASGGVPPYTYLWSTGGQTNELKDLAPGRYFLTITDANECIRILEASIDMSVSTLDLDISQIVMLPNPANDQLVISSIVKNINSVTLYAVDGKTMLFQHFGTPVDRTELSLQHIPSGVYIISIKTAQHQLYRQKIIKF